MIGIPAGRVVVQQLFRNVVRAIQAGDCDVVQGVVVVLESVFVVVGCVVVATRLVKAGPAGGSVELLAAPGKGNCQVWKKFSLLSF